MVQLQKSQFWKMALILLLVGTPLLPSSVRPAYIYFLFNLLVVALGAESGALKAFLKPAMEDKEEGNDAVAATSVTNDNINGSYIGGSGEPEGNHAVRRSVSEKAKSAAKVVHQKMRKCPSMPSLFFIGGFEEEEEAAEEDEGEGEMGVPTAQELFAAAETFIGNFYKQLKIQREESWKKIHGLCPKAA